MPRCLALGCNENGNHKFPKEPHVQKLWLKAIRIKKDRISDRSRLCSKHFTESDYQGDSFATGMPQVHKYLKKTAVPSIFSWTSTPAPSASARARDRRHLNRSARKQLYPAVSPLTENPEETIVQKNNEPCPDVQLQIIPDVQLEIEVAHEIVETVLLPVPQSISTQTPYLFRLLSTEDMLSDPKSVLFYTGLETIEKFKLVFSTLLPMANFLEYKCSQVTNMSVEDQFLLMLIKIRRDKTDFELSKLFGICTSEVGNIFVTWVNFVYELWSKIDIWPSRSLVNYYMPTLFKKYHPSTRIIVDGTEIPITKPKNPTAQQATFSSYKHHNTVKFLIGATPGGLISFCSEGYAGSTSDRQMTERSSLLAKCDEQDSIMADRGFNVQDLFAHRNIAIQTPTFMKGKSQLPGVKLQHDRKLASNRIHIERLIGLTKTYKILKSDVNAYYVPLISRVFFICVMLSNFKEGIVK